MFQITELEAAVISGEKSELADLLERVRQEKDLLEKENAALQQKASAMACENERLKDQISSLQDELMVKILVFKKDFGVCSKDGSIWWTVFSSAWMVWGTAAK